MRPVLALALSTLGGLVITLIVRHATPVPSLPTPGWGGKMEHCAIAIGMIGGAILAVFANPITGPLAFGVMTAALVWLLVCE